MTSNSLQRVTIHMSLLCETVLLPSTPFSYESNPAFGTFIFRPHSSQTSYPRIVDWSALYLVSLVRTPTLVIPCAKSNGHQHVSTYIFASQSFALPSGTIYLRIRHHFWHFHFSTSLWTNCPCVVGAPQPQPQPLNLSSIGLLASFSHSLHNI